MIRQNKNEKSKCTVCCTLLPNKEKKNENLSCDLNQSFLHPHIQACQEHQSKTTKLL